MSERIPTTGAAESRDFGRVRAGVQAAESRGERSRLVYEQTVLTALDETENALSG